MKRRRRGTSALPFHSPPFAIRYSLFALLVACVPSSSSASDWQALCADRAAIERVYYNHRTETNKPPFEQLLPADAIEKLVREDWRKESALKRVYHIEITPEQAEAEVQRINATTRAPEMLAEFKAALDNDTNRFARTVARPIVVDRVLRDKFANDAELHAPQRQQAEKIRSRLIALRKKGASVDKLTAMLKELGTNNVTESTWQLSPPPAEAGKAVASTADEMEIRRRYGPDARILSPSGPGGAGSGSDQKFYFSDLPPQLQQVLQAQLHYPGDTSAVIEMPNGFLYYVTREKTDQIFSAAVLFIPKLDFETWLARQPVVPF